MGPFPKFPAPPLLDPKQTKRSFLKGILEKAVRAGTVAHDLHNTVSSAADVYDEILKGQHD